MATERFPEERHPRPSVPPGGPAPERTVAAGPPVDETPLRPRPTDDRSVGELVRELGDEMATLISQEFALARAELGQKASQAARNAVSLTLGGVVMYAGFLVLLFAAVFALLLVIPLWAAALVVGFLAVCIGAVMAAVAASRLRPNKLKLEHTTRETRATTRMMKEHLS